MMNILLNDLKTQYIPIREEILSAIDQLCMESAFIKGKYVEVFEKEFIESHKADFGIGCSNGTSAISLALEALGIGKGDEVLLPSHTFVATAEAVCHTGATPVFIDIKSSDYTVDCQDLEKKITKKSKAIIPVHIYGTPCDMNEIMAIASAYSLKIIEDCAQAHFAKYHGQFVGTFGDCSSFSFYPGKNLGAYGDAGFIFCKQLSIQSYLKRLVDHGRLDKFDHDIVGYNNRIDALQCAILSVKMKYIGKWTKRRQEIANFYNNQLRKHGFKTIEYESYKEPVYHVYNIEVNDRDIVKQKLSDKGIQTGIHYPEPVHLLKAFRGYNCMPLPISQKIASRIISLPLHPGMTDSQIEYIISAFVE